MSQKSSVMQLPQFVPKALTSDMEEDYLTAMSKKETSRTESHLNESLVKTSLVKLNWEALHTHLQEIHFSSGDLNELLGHIRRCNDLICKRPQERYEQQRNQFFRSLQSFIGVSLGDEAEAELLKEIGLIHKIEHGYHGILDLVSKCSLSQHPAPVRVSASISRACYEYKELKTHIDKTLSKAKYLDLTEGPFIEDNDGNSMSPDTILESLVETVAMTLVMEAYQNNWFVGEIVTLPILPSVGDEERYQAGSIQMLALCWRQWERVEKRRRYLEGELLTHSGKDRPVGLPDQIATLFEYCPRDKGLSDREVYDFIANTRLRDRLVQTFAEIEIETGMSGHTVGIADGAALPPDQVVSNEEYHACYALSELLGFSIVKDTEQSCGLRLLEWVRGYIVLKEIVKGRIDVVQGSGDDYAVLLSENELTSILRSCGLDDLGAKRFIEKTCLHRASRDLFDCPIVKIAETGYLIFGPAVINLNVPMAILSNLSNRSENLERKGKAFERSVMQVFRDRNIDAFSFRVFRDNQEFEYDAVVPWGGYIFVFECKNHSLSGNDPARTYYFDLEVLSHTKQAHRLATALEEYPDIIEQQLGQKYVGGKIIPCVVHSLPYATSGDSKGVYFIDFSMLRRFFEQPYLRVKVPHRIGNSVLLHRTAIKKFWQGDSPTARDLIAQMTKPFQIELAWRHLNLKPFQFPISKTQIVATHELVREQMSVETVCEVLGADSDYVLREIETISEQARILRSKSEDSQGSSTD